MSIVYVKNLPGREADWGMANDRTFRRSWLVLTDTRYQFEGQLLADGIAAGYLPVPFLSTHPNDATYLCKRLRGRQERNSPLHWIVDADFDTKPWGDEEEEKPPLDRRARIRWSTTKYQKALEKDINGKGIVNSAGMPFNPPPLKDTSRWTATVTKNLALVPPYVLDLPDKLNSGSFTLGGVTVAPKVAKIMAINIGELQVEQDQEFYSFQYTLEFDPIDKWKGKYLQQGILQKSGSDRIPCIDKHGQPVRSPVPLDSAGAQLSNPTTDNVVYTDYDICDSVDFNSLLPLA